MKKKILLIEDNPEVRENTGEILELANYDVITAENGKEGIDKAKSYLPDVIICDIMMPEMDGYGVLQVLSKIPQTASIPFIFLTAKAEKTDFRKGMNLGADDYLTKPFEEAELLEVIALRLQRKERIQKSFGEGEEGLGKFLEAAKGLGELQDLSLDRRKRQFKKKDTIYFEGDNPIALYFINKGKVKAIKTDDYGKELVTDLYGEGEFMGYLPLLEGAGYRDTAIAIDDTEVSLIPREDFTGLITRNKDVANKFIKMLSNNIAEKEARLLKLAYGSVRERTAEALLDLHENHADPEFDDIRISREDLASIVGTATESLIRTLSEFKSDGLIEIDGRKIRIMKEQALRKLAGRSL
jgi:CheY-like chemotaxis protein/CRP-like cAMP-binding protein